MRYLVRIAVVFVVLVAAVGLTLGAGLPYSPLTAYANHPYYAPATAIVEITPETLQLDSNAKNVSVQISVPGFDERKLNKASVRLDGTIPPQDTEGAGPQKGGEKNYVTVKFSRQLLIDKLQATGRTSGWVTLAVTGFIDGHFFRGTDQIFVVH